MRRIHSGKEEFAPGRTSFIHDTVSPLMWFCNPDSDNVVSEAPVYESLPQMNSHLKLAEVVSLILQNPQAAFPLSLVLSSDLEVPSSSFKQPFSSASQGPSPCFT